MTVLLRLPVVLVVMVIIAGCTSSMVRVLGVDDLHIIHKSLTEEQVREAIIEGAETAGWLAKDLGNGNILATYHIRVHTVHVQIDYINSNYSIHYRSSNGMKMFCSERDKKKNVVKVSGRDSCIGTGVPSYIHGAYKEWVDALNTGIQNSLASI